MPTAGKGISDATSDVAPPPEGRRWALAALVVLVVALAPFCRGVLLGQSLYFRDLSGTVFPFRQFLLQGLGQGHLWYWNPYLHEGEPISYPPVSYPVDLLQLARPDEWGLSLLLVLHVPLAGLFFLLLARELGVGPAAAAAGALIYALGGFALSTLNLFIYTEALAWAPLVIVGLLRCAEGGRREIALSAAFTGIAISTLGLEIVLQTMLLGLLLAFRPGKLSPLLRLAAATALGVGLAGVTLLGIADFYSDSQRAGGLTTEVVLAHSVHPMTLLQVLVGNLYGDLLDVTRLWWGQNFFPRGFPYFLSLYLGAAVLSLALVGITRRSGWTLRIALAVALGLVVCLGRWAGWGVLVGALPALRSLRFPTKAFFTCHLGVALLASMGLSRLGLGLLAWRRLRFWCFSIGCVLALFPAIPMVLPGLYRFLILRFFPPEFPLPERLLDAARVFSDASLGGLVALLAAGVSILVGRGMMAPPRGALVVASLAIADLLRTGAGLNPTVSPSFFRLSPEVAAAVGSLREGRIFTCVPLESLAYAKAQRALVASGLSHEVFSFALERETLLLNYGMAEGVRSAYSPDVTMFVPRLRLLQGAEGSCRDFPSLTERLRRAGVTHVLSLDPLADPSISLDATLHSSRIDPLVVRVYSLEGALPLVFVANEVRLAPDAASAASVPEALLQAGATVVEDSAPGVTGASGRILKFAEEPGHAEIQVETDKATAVVLREGFAAGWSARLDGSPARVLRAEGRYMAVRVGAGRSLVSLRYRPPHFVPGAALSAASILGVAALFLSGRRTAERPA